MKRISLLAFSVLSLCASPFAFGQQSQEDENLYFETEEFIRIPKFTVSLGARRLSGLKASFSGSGKIARSTLTADTTTPTGQIPNNDWAENPTLVYDDGYIGVDTRSAVRYDSEGHPVFYPDGSVARTPYATGLNNFKPSDGMTNSWSAYSADQLVGTNTVAFHAYSATTIDSGPLAGSESPVEGVEVLVTRDMNDRNKRFSWALTSGLGMSDIRSHLTSQMSAYITTITDTYSVVPKQNPGSTDDLTVTTPYTSGQTVSVVLRNRDGTVVYSPGSNGLPSTSLYTLSVDNSHLLVIDPLGRVVSSAVLDTTKVVNSYKLKGAFYTLRFGPTVNFAVNDRLRFTVSVGGAVAFAGATYTVNSDFHPVEDGHNVTPFTVTESDTERHILPGFYVDVTAEYALTETTGFYAGCVYQNNGSYKQEVDSLTADYSTDVDLSNLTGFRTGINYRF